MKVRIDFTVDVDERFRRALRAYYGRTGLATRDEVRDWYKDNAASVDADMTQEYDDKQSEQSTERA